IKLLPYPQIKQIDGLPESEFILDKAIYEKSQKFPFELVQIDAPAFFREQEIVRLQVAGVQYLPAQGQILKYSRIVLQLKFIGGQIVTKPRTFLQSNAEEVLYKNAL
ncbi:MAG: C25 family peptidase propeptide domain-containing protein, partial [bacterium]